MGKVRERLGALKHRMGPNGGRVDEMTERLDAIRRRVAVLESEVQENRELNRRLAELTDIVTELLVPLSERDEQQVRELLDTYRNRL